MANFNSFISLIDSSLRRIITFTVKKGTAKIIQLGTIEKSFIANLCLVACHADF